MCCAEDGRHLHAPDHDDTYTVREERRTSKGKGWPTRAYPILWQETRSWLLAAGYAVVAVDVRGTGASFGQWRAPWQPEERADSVKVVDWIVSQPWSNQQVLKQARKNSWLSCHLAALRCPIRLSCESQALLAICLASSDDVWSALQCVLWGVSYDGECPCSKRLSSALCTALLVYLLDNRLAVRCTTPDGLCV